MKPSTLVKIIFLHCLIFINFAPAVQAQSDVPVVAFYYAWFDQTTWTSGQSVDLPEPRYVSAERGTIERHVAEAQGAGIDAFIQSWYGPTIENNQTETNFKSVARCGGHNRLQRCGRF